MVHNPWVPVTLTAKNFIPQDGIEFTLTQSERSQIASFTVAAERHRRRQNEADRKRQQQAERAEQARMGITWDGPDAA